MEPECESSRRSSARSSGSSSERRGAAERPSMLFRVATGFVAVASAFASGCVRTVLVPEGAPIRIGPETKAHVYAMTDDEWRLSENRVTIPEGWYCVPPSFVEEPEP